MKALHPFLNRTHTRTVGRPNYCTSRDGGAFVAPCPSLGGNTAGDLSRAETTIHDALRVALKTILEQMETTSHARNWTSEGGLEAWTQYEEQMQSLVSAMKTVREYAYVRATLLAGEAR